MTEAEEMRKYAEAHGCGTLDITPCWAKGYGGEQEKIWCGQEYAKAAGLGVRPLPCVRIGEKIIKNCSEKEHLSKIDEELNELKKEVYLYYFSDYGKLERIAEEAADTITAITTMLEALGIDREARDEAQRRVNAKNRERGRL